MDRGTWKGHSPRGRRESDMTEQLSVSLDNLIQKLVSEVRELYRETRLGSLHGVVMELSSDHFSFTAILGFNINSHSPVALFPFFFFFITEPKMQPNTNTFFLFFVQPDNIPLF